MKISEMTGKLETCNLSPRHSNYDYVKTISILIDNYGFKELGSGGFGVILGHDDCVMKLIKSLDRCSELEKEKEIYMTIQSKREILDKLEAKVPRFYGYFLLDKFCHFNIERVHSPLSGYGNVENSEEPYGHGYVIEQVDDKMTMMEKGKERDISTKKVYLIDRPGTLVHFYVNHYDLDTNDKLAQNQGCLMGRRSLEHYFGAEAISRYAFEIGQLLGFLVFQCHLVPTDVEVVRSAFGMSRATTRSNLRQVLGTEFNNRVVRPYIIDFNESTQYQEFKDSSTPMLIARAMYYKNGKNYFPSTQTNNPYSQSFATGFISGSSFTIDDDDDLSQRLKSAMLILEEYNKL